MALECKRLSTQFCLLVTAVALLSACGNKSGKVQVGNAIPSVPNSKPPSAMVSFTFDDGYTSIIEEALPMLRKYSYRATAAIVVNFVGRSGFMKQADIAQLVSNKWEIASHSLTHTPLPQLPIKDAEGELTQSQARLREMGFGTVDVFVPPNSAWTAPLRDIAAKYYKVVAIGTDRLNDIPLAERARVHRVTIQTKTTKAMIDQLLDKSLNEHKWLVFELHGVGPSASGYMVSRDTLAYMAEGVKARDIRVVTLSEGFDLATAERGQ